MIFATRGGAAGPHNFKRVPVKLPYRLLMRLSSRLTNILAIEVRGHCGRAGVPRQDRQQSSHFILISFNRVAGKMGIEPRLTFPMFVRT